MAFFNWDERYSVGVKRFDDQHQQLIAMLNELYAAMGSGKADPILSRILSNLVQYTKTHFAEEEALMQRHGYPNSAKHKMEHDALAKQVADLQMQFQTGKTMLSVKTGHFLKDWLANHILGLDKLYGPFLNGKGIS